MKTFIIHAKSICHVTHLSEIEAESEDDALDAYHEGQPTDLIGVQIHDSVGFLDSAPDEVHPEIQGVFIPYPDPIPDDTRNGAAGSSLKDLFGEACDILSTLRDGGLGSEMNERVDALLNGEIRT